jgi:NDP-sugar pyrophosphorylase family protein
MIGAVVKRKSATQWAVVLAGGSGTRLAGLYKHCAKPFIPVAGKPFIEWVLSRLADLGVTHVAVALGHRWDTAEYYLKHRAADGLTIRTVCETKPLGTAGALLNAMTVVPEEVDTLVVANGDALIYGNLNSARSRMLEEPALDGVLCSVRLADAAAYRTLTVDHDGLLRSIRRKQPGGGLVNGGLYVMRRSAIAQIRKLGATALEREALPKLIAQGSRWAVHVAAGPLLHIDTREQLAASEAELWRRQRMKKTA